ncbi:response regulator [Yangia mangrovi]|uniref:Response regulator n=2 Tax=Alloyangia mangrovi TaxID=1779329 RepID=A0ABT2KSM1_9RHOB|nr:response regulator [Alloyangia mangrovi]MCT4372816.1 response regulator [Alloyangia mangrovi]
MSPLTEEDHFMRLLAVDDSPVMRDLIPLLVDNDMVVRSAASGSAALSILQGSEQPFDCLLLDIEMPGMDGIELCRHVRSLPRYTLTPVIMLTARTDGGSIEAAFAAGANDYITKTLNTRTLRGRLRVAERLRDASGMFRCDRRRLSTFGKPRGAHPFCASQSVTILGTGQMIDPFSLGNYLAQLPRRDIEHSRIFGARLENFEKIYRSTTTPEFGDLLVEVAEGLQALVRASSALTCYDGNGTFICLARSADLPATDQMEAELAAHLQATWQQGATAALPPLTITLGTPVTPFANKTQRVRKSLLRAQARLEARSARKGLGPAGTRHPRETISMRAAGLDVPRN